jgi:putative ATP-dependent endonuclease of the OLD family
MQISTLTLQNFRCFGPTAVTIRLDRSTTLIGANGAGKTAVLEALVRLFGITSADRQITRTDFYLPPDVPADEVEEASFFIEARIDFPELADSTNGGAIPECFNQMVVAAQGASPYCRIRLEATWWRTSTPDGEIEEEISWVTTDAADPPPEAKRPMRPFDRAQIQVVYVPATRDPVRQMRRVAGSLLYRLLRAVIWSDAVREAVTAASEQLHTAFRGEAGVSQIESALAQAWRRLHDFSALSAVELQPVSHRFEDLLRNIELAFLPAEGGVVQGIDRLSDGLKSLFYFALVGATFDIEEAARAAGPGQHAIDADELRLPVLKLFAIEEPENHLSPHYLGRILGMLQRIASSPRGQLLLTSQSPSILARIDPSAVRHVRLDHALGVATVRALTLPSAEDAGEAYKFVKEAVRAFPELYFASLVVLGEGDSEEIVIPRVAAAAGLAVDVNFVAIVPLGGRFVNHFWRLLSDLGIPYVTLLDLDRDRRGGGWGRIRYACVQLLNIGRTKEEILLTDAGVLSDEEFNVMRTWPLKGENDLTYLTTWVERLEAFDVFFSAPLDLDFMMLRKFGDAYRAATPGSGPKIPPEGSPEYDKRIAEARKATLKERGSDAATYLPEEQKEFIWYSYLFLRRGKPITHILALNRIEDDALRAGMPEVLQRLISRMREKLGQAEEI